MSTDDSDEDGGDEVNDDLIQQQQQQQQQPVNKNSKTSIFNSIQNIVWTSHSELVVFVVIVV